MLFLSGHESWSETFFGSANDPPPPSPLACMSPELWILPWGKQKLLQVSPELPPPLICSRSYTRISGEETYEIYIVIHGSITYIVCFSYALSL